MHPVLLLIPAAGLIFGPRLWVRHVINQHNGDDDSLPGTGSEFARSLLDQHELYGVKVELTDMGDHYDPHARAVRLARDNFDSQSLSAITTAAHEVAHALQHAAGYPPFEWRKRLVKVARVTGMAGTAVLIAVPATSLFSRRPLPPPLIGISALAMLGTGLSAQIAALPTEFNASFGRAMPMLKESLSEEQQADARRILWACSYTYLASSLAGMIHVWPWLGGGRAFLTPQPVHSGNPPSEVRTDKPVVSVSTGAKRTRGVQRSHIRGGTFEAVFRRTAKPLVRHWLRLSRPVQ